MAQGAQLEKVIYVKTDTDEFMMHGRPCELSANSFVPPSRPLAKERNVFNSERKVSSILAHLPIIDIRKILSLAVFHQF